MILLAPLVACGAAPATSPTTAESAGHGWTECRGDECDALARDWLERMRTGAATVADGEKGASEDFLLLGSPPESADLSEEERRFVDSVPALLDQETFGFGDTPLVDPASDPDPSSVGPEDVEAALVGLLCRAYMSHLDPSLPGAVVVRDPNERRGLAYTGGTVHYSSAHLRALFRPSASGVSPPTDYGSAIGGLIAHELGHHFVRHAGALHIVRFWQRHGARFPASQNDTHKIELFADYFAGRMLSGERLPLEPTAAMFELLSPEHTTTHPRFDKRIEALNLGVNGTL